MAFNIFRRKGGGDAAPAPAEHDAEERDAEDANETLGDDADPESAADDDAHFLSRALGAIPGGASTGSKRRDALWGAGGDGPTHFLRAAGCEIVTAGGGALVDCTMALGSVALGYAEPSVTRAVVEAAASGHVAGLSSVREVEVAERLCEMVPCAERVRFLKTGAEACAAAVSIARAATGRRAVVGSGYFGWLDWWSERGAPDYEHVPFDDVAALERACAAAGTRLAAIVLEPVVERLPSPQWLAAARRIADASGAVLVFDEIKTGFRFHAGGYQAVAGVTPDIATFGKAMANGFPLSAVVGREAVMDAAFDRGLWVSSTLASEATSLAAAAAVMDWHARADVASALAETGREMRDAVGRALAASGVGGVAVEGPDPMWLMRFDDGDVQDHFLSLAMQAGVLFKRGAYNFASLAHDDRAIAAIESAASAAFVALREEGLA